MNAGIYATLGLLAVASFVCFCTMLMSLQYAIILASLALGAFAIETHFFGGAE